MDWRSLLPLLFVLIYGCGILLCASYTTISPSLLRPNMVNPHAATYTSIPSPVRPQKPQPLLKMREEPVGVEGNLARARAAIRRAATTTKSQAISAHTNIYRNAAAFHQSYTEMEKHLRVFVYEEGEPPLLHDGPCKNIYTTEGRFIHELELQHAGNLGLRTSDPNQAHLFFLPFSVSKLVQFLYTPNSHDHKPIQSFVADYISVLASKHPYWNRTAGADHFMLSCHDWGPDTSLANDQLYHNSIRALCNANTTEGFIPRKDVSIPEINLVSGDIPAKLLSSPPDSAPRPYLAFFAGGVHGPIRPILLDHWKGKDKDMPVFEYLPKGVDYHDFMLRSKFCLCPSGYEVASPRVVEAIYAGCIPVLLSEGYVLPFSDVLRWKEFSVTVAVAEIPRLKEVLEAVPEEKVRRLREGVKAVRRHFEFNHPPKRFDAFNMILHSVWLRRLNMRLLT